MSKPLALRPKGKHPLHLLGEAEIWPADAAQGPVRDRVLAGLPKLERAAFPQAGMRPDKMLQQIFHTEERIVLADVPRLCCSLPGIGGCILARRHEALAEWSIPLDLHAGDVLAAASGAMDRLTGGRDAGWGEVAGITLHLDGGCASLLRSGAMQLLILHEARGFAPGVREKLSAALAALDRASS